jgi:predicted DNA-binding transcriptional regulator AlpA
MAETEEAKNFLTIRDAAQLTGLAIKTWYEGGAGTASVPRVRFGRSIRLLRKDVERFVNDRIMAAEQTITNSERS